LEKGFELDLKVFSYSEKALVLIVRSTTAQATEKNLE
jgi:hypothetical protein